MKITKEQIEVFGWLSQGNVVRAYKNDRLFIGQRQLSKETVSFFVKHKLVVFEKKPLGDTPGKIVLSDTGKAVLEKITPVLEEKFGPPPDHPAPSPRKSRACPFCGEEVLKVARKCKHCGEFLDGRPAADPSQAIEDNDAEQAEIIWEGRPSWTFYAVYWLAGVVLLFPYGIGLLVIIYALVDRQMRKFIHTTQKVAATGGILSRQAIEIEISDIRGIEISQSDIERILGLGSIQIGSRQTSGLKVVFKGITDPVKVRNGIWKTKDEVGA